MIRHSRIAMSVLQRESPVVVTGVSASELVFEQLC
jgi:hypothetical protein